MHLYNQKRLIRLLFIKLVIKFQRLENHLCLSQNICTSYYKPSQRKECLKRSTCWIYVTFALYGTSKFLRKFFFQKYIFKLNLTRFRQG